MKPTSDVLVALAGEAFLQRASDVTTPDGDSQHIPGTGGGGQGYYIGAKENHFWDFSDEDDNDIETETGE